MDTTTELGRIWRRTVSAASALLLIGALGACGGDESSGASSSGEDIRLVQIPTSISQFNTSVNAGAREEAKRLGAELDAQIPGATDVTSQTSTVNAVIASRPDAILIEPIDGKGMVASLAKAKQAGIKVVTYDSNVEDESIPSSFVATDYVEGGRLVARALTDLIDNQGKVLHVAGFPGLPFSEKLLEGWNDVVKDEPDIQSLPAQYNDYDEQKTAAILAPALTRDPDLAGLMIQSGGKPQIQAGLNVLNQKGVAGQVRIAVWDATPDTVRFLKDGKIDVIGSVPARSFGQKLVQQAVKAVKGEKVDSNTELKNCVITRENVDDPEIKPCIYLPEAKF